MVFISGDVHWGEISREDAGEGPPLYDVTASGLNQEWPTVEPNRRRVGPVVREYNFGMIEIDWSQSDPRVDLLAVDGAGRELYQEYFAPRTQAKYSEESYRYDASDNLVRYFWYAGEGWQSQDVTAIAVDGEVGA